MSSLEFIHLRESTFLHPAVIQARAFALSFVGLALFDPESFFALKSAILDVLNLEARSAIWWIWSNLVLLVLLQDSAPDRQVNSRISMLDGYRWLRQLPLCKSGSIFSWCSGSISCDFLRHNRLYFLLHILYFGLFIYYSLYSCRLDLRYLLNSILKASKWGWLWRNSFYRSKLPALLGALELKLLQLKLLLLKFVLGQLFLTCWFLQLEEQVLLVFVQCFRHGLQVLVVLLQRWVCL